MKRTKLVEETTSTNEIQTFSEKKKFSNPKFNGILRASKYFNAFRCDGLDYDNKKS